MKPANRLRLPRGRGAAVSPANRYSVTVSEEIDDGWGSLDAPLEVRMRGGTSAGSVDPIPVTKDHRTPS